MNSPLFIDGHVAIGAFDFDGNILRTPTKLYLINKKTGKEEIFEGHTLDQHPEMIRGDNSLYKLHPNPEKSFAHFRDHSERGEHQGPDELIRDMLEAIKEGNIAPSFESFKNTFLIPARFFAIITARGHSSENFARAMLVINREMLTKDEQEEQYKNIISLHELLEGKKAQFDNKKAAQEYYFHWIVRYYAVSSPSTSNWLEVTQSMSSAEKKVKAMQNFLGSIQRKVVNIHDFNSLSYSIGFSDDSIVNIYAMLGFFQNERINPHYTRNEDKIRLYYTGPKNLFCIPLNTGIQSTQEGDILVIRL